MIFKTKASFLAKYSLSLGLLSAVGATSVYGATASVEFLNDLLRTGTYGDEAVRTLLGSIHTAEALSQAAKETRMAAYAELAQKGDMTNAKFNEILEHVESKAQGPKIKTTLAEVQDANRLVGHSTHRAPGAGGREIPGEHGGGGGGAETLGEARKITPVTTELDPKTMTAVENDVHQGWKNDPTNNHQVRPKPAAKEAGLDTLTSLEEYQKLVKDRIRARLKAQGLDASGASVDAVFAKNKNSFLFFKDQGEIDSYVERMVKEKCVSAADQAGCATAIKKSIGKLEVNKPYEDIKALDNWLLSPKNTGSNLAGAREAVHSVAKVLNRSAAAIDGAKAATMVGDIGKEVHDEWILRALRDNGLGDFKSVADPQARAQIEALKAKDPGYYGPLMEDYSKLPIAEQDKDLRNAVSALRGMQNANALGGRRVEPLLDALRARVPDMFKP